MAADNLAVYVTEAGLAAGGNPGVIPVPFS
jgi:hypothetical protein